ncbi:chemotaxis protein CheW [Desulfofalx alkaliphila]|uniref:chemotaxis protein CheW n=1 Tax=Desulfofalx alkaliphila TaxID=105483 RepID=UPI0004E1850D|nr:chemotaxis protein CheW [Desulfofalx alkaliphila]
MSSQGREEEQIVVFQLHNQTYGIDITSVREIIRMEEITEIPNAPDFLEGIINLRGGIVPIIDLGKRFGLVSGERTSQSRIIIVQVSNQIFGMIVDSVQEVLRVPASSIEPPPPMLGGVDAAYLRGVALLEERLVILLEHSRILFEKEQQQLEEVINQ